MIKNRFLHLFALVATSLTLTAGVAAADTTCGPDVTIHYNKGSGSSIKVTKIEYRLDGAKGWHTEQVANTVIDKGKEHTFKSQRLGSVAKGQKIDLRAVFKRDAGQGYSDNEERSPIRESGKVCENNVTYNVDVE